MIIFVQSVEVDQIRTMAEIIDDNQNYFTHNEANKTCELKH